VNYYYLIFLIARINAKLIRLLTSQIFILTEKRGKHFAKMVGMK